MVKGEIFIPEPEESETERKKRKRQAELDKIFYDTMTLESDNEASRKQKNEVGS